MQDIKRLTLMIRIGWADLIVSAGMIVLAVIMPIPIPTSMAMLFLVFLIAHTVFWWHMFVSMPRRSYRRLWLKIRRNVRMAMMRCEYAAIRFCVFLGACRFGLWVEDKCMYLHKNIELQWGEEWFEFTNGVLEYGGTDWRWRRSTQCSWSLYQGDKNRGSVCYHKDSLAWGCEIDGAHYPHLLYMKSASEGANAVEAAVGVWTKEGNGEKEKNT